MTITPDGWIGLIVGLVLGGIISSIGWWFAQAWNKQKESGANEEIIKSLRTNFEELKKQVDSILEERKEDGAAAQLLKNMIKEINDLDRKLENVERKFDVFIGNVVNKVFNDKK